jgi:tRNA(fMet)-specific endonuclease VapC
MGQVLTAFSTAPILLFDGAAASIFDELVAQRLRIGRMDLRIASIAMAQERVVVTRNARDFSKVPGLRIEDWTI